MRRATVISFGVAAVFAAGALVLGRSWLEQQTAQSSSAGMTTIVVAARSLNFGDTIGATDVREVRWPVEAVPVGAFRSLAALHLAQGQHQALEQIAPNEPLLASRITGAGQRAILSAVVSPGMRAFAIRVDDVVGVGGFVQPNDRVDIILVRAEDPGRVNGSFRSDLLLQNLRVLGIDQISAASENQPRVVRAVTLEVSAEQAQMLSLASQAGSLRLALRNQAGGANEVTRTITLQDLHNGPAVAAPTPQRVDRPVRRAAPAEPQGQPVVIVRGNDRDVVHVAQ